jgi:hypothetical protein
VEKVLGPVNYIVRRSRRSRPQIVHIDKMKPYRGSPPPSWLYCLDDEVPDMAAENAKTQEQTAVEVEEPELNIPANCPVLS